MTTTSPIPSTPIPSAGAVPAPAGSRTGGGVAARWLHTLRAELFKLRTTPGPWIVAGVTIVLTVLVIVTVFLVRHNTSGLGHQHSGVSFVAPHTVRGLRRLLGAGIGGLWLCAVLGTLVTTGEYRYQVITTTLLVEPRRARVLSAKAAAAVLMGVLLGVATLVVVAVLGIPLLAAEGGSVSGLLDQAGAVIPGLLAAYALFALLGLGFGTLLRNQVASIVVLLLLGFLLDPILEGLVPAIGKWLPTATGEAVAGGLVPAGQAANLLSTGVAALILVAWGVAPAVIGYFTTFRRDVT